MLLLWMLCGLHDIRWSPPSARSSLWVVEPRAGAFGAAVVQPVEVAVAVFVAAVISDGADGRVCCTCVSARAVVGQCGWKE